MNKSNQILRAENLSFNYGGEQTPTILNISFSLSEGEILGVLGPNGGGKSTLMKIIAGLLTNYSGEIYFQDCDLKNLKKFPYSKFSYVPQHSELNGILPVKVLEYMNFARALYSDVSANDIDELLNLVGILHKKDCLISKLSGGEKQRVLIARALVNKPKLLLLDEPTKGLDSNGQDQLLAIIEKIKSRDKTSVIIVDHNINQIIRNCKKILCLNKTSHWHNKTDLLTKNILEDIYHCEFEHLLIHENDLQNNHDSTSTDPHLFCDHDHHQSLGKDPHSLLRGVKK